MKKVIILLLFMVCSFSVFTQDIRQDRAMTHYNRGNEFMGKSEYTLAIEEYTDTVLLIPDYFRAYFNRGNAYYLCGEYQKAVDDYTKAITLMPGYTSAYYNRGVTFYNNGDIEKALDDWDQVLRLEPDYAQVQRDIEIAQRLLEERQRPDIPAVQLWHDFTIYIYSNRNGAAQIKRPWQRQRRQLTEHFFDVSEPEYIIKPPQSEIKVIAGLPFPDSGKVYKLQVGAWYNVDNAIKVFKRLRSFRFKVELDNWRGVYQVYVAGVPAYQVSDTVQRLEGIGLKEVWIRE